MPSIFNIDIRVNFYHVDVNQFTFAKTFQNNKEAKKEKKAAKKEKKEKKAARK